jgi:hypothetical protein
VALVPNEAQTEAGKTGFALAAAECWAAARDAVPPHAPAREATMACSGAAQSAAQPMTAVSQ